MSCGDFFVTLTTPMESILREYHLQGLVVGLATFLIIGLFHPVVIKCHYYFGVRSRWWFLLLGIVMCGVSVLVTDSILSILAGVVAFSSFWTVKEIVEQEERVRKGWFPANPRRRSGGSGKTDGHKA